MRSHCPTTTCRCSTVQGILAIFRIQWAADSQCVLSLPSLPASLMSTECNSLTRGDQCCLPEEGRPCECKDGQEGPIVIVRASFLSFPFITLPSSPPSLTVPLPFLLLLSLAVPSPFFFLIPLASSCPLLMLNKKTTVCKNDKRMHWLSLTGGISPEQWCMQ